MIVILILVKVKSLPLAIHVNIKTNDLTFVFLSRLQVTRKFFTVLWKLWCSSVQLLVLPSTLIWRLFCHRYTTTVIFYFYSTQNQPLRVLRGRVRVVFQRGYFYLCLLGVWKGRGLVVASLHSILWPPLCTCKSRLLLFFYPTIDYHLSAMDQLCLSINPLHVNNSRHILLFFILFSIHFLRCCQREFVQQSRTSIIVDHFLFPCDLYVWFTGVGVILLGEIRCWSPLGVKGLNCEIVTRFPHLFCTSLFLRQCNTYRSFSLKSLPH